MRVMAVVAMTLAAGAVCFGQSTTAKMAGTTRATTAPATAPIPKNLDKALEEEISFDVSGKRLEYVFEMLRDTTQTNMAVNWTALGVAGITRETPVTLHLKKVPYEHVLRSLMEVLPADKTRPNYMLGGNAVEITTTADLGKQAVPRLYDIGRAAGATFDGKPPASDDLAKNEEVVRQTLHRLLLNLHEDVDANGRNLVLKNHYLAAMQSRRAQVYMQWAIGQFEFPTKLGKGIPGTLTSVREKKAWEALSKLKVPVTELAKNPQAVAPELNVILLPGTQDELAKADAKLDFIVTDGGIVELGPAADVQWKVNLGVYDLREMVKRMAVKSKTKPAPAAGELARQVVATLKEKVLPYHNTGEWGEIDKSPSSITLCGALMVVFAPVPTHRTIQTQLEQMAR